MDHLVCFLPGTHAVGATKGITKRKALELDLLTADDLESLFLAEDLAETCFEMYSVTSTSLAPEIAYFNIEGISKYGFDGGNKSSEYINDIIIKPNDRHNLLHPETVESLFVLYRITKDPKYREWGWKIFKAFEEHDKLSWFPFILCDTDWMGREVFHGDPKGTPAQMEANDKGTRAGAYGLLINSVVLRVRSFLIEPMCSKFSPRIVWVMSNFFVCVCMVATAIICTWSLQAYHGSIQDAIITPDGKVKTVAIILFFVLDSVQCAFCHYSTVSCQ